MLNNLIGGIVVRMARSRLNGYYTIIGGVGYVLYFLLVVIGKILPEHNLPLTDMSWEDAFGTLSIGLAMLGVVNKGFKIGVDTQAPAYTMPVRESKGKVLLEGPMG